MIAAEPAGAVAGTAATTFATMPFPIGVVFTAATIQLSCVVPAGGTGFVGTAHVTVFAAAVAAAPAVTVNPLTEADGAEIVNCNEAGSSRVVLEVNAREIDPPGVAEAVAAVQARLTVLLLSSVKVTVGVCPSPEAPTLAV